MYLTLDAIYAALLRCNAPLYSPMFSSNEHTNCLTGTIHTTAIAELMVRSKNNEASKLSCHGNSVSRSGRLNDFIISGMKVIKLTALMKYRLIAESLVTSHNKKPKNAPTNPILSGNSR